MGRAPDPSGVTRLRYAPHIKVVDNKDVKQSEVAEAQMVVGRCEESLKLMFGNHFLALKLQKMVGRIRLHAELIDVVYGRTAALNRCEMPSSWTINTKRFLQFWDYEAVLSSQEIRHVYLALRELVVLARARLFSRGSAPKSTFEVFKAVAEGLDKGSKLSTAEQWDAAFKVPHTPVALLCDHAAAGCPGRAAAADLRATG